MQRPLATLELILVGVLHCSISFAISRCLVGSVSFAGPLSFVGSVLSSGSVSLGVVAELESMDDAITMIVTDVKISMSAAVNAIFFMRCTSFFALTFPHKIMPISCKRVLVKYY